MGTPIDIQLVKSDDDFFDIDWTEDGDFSMTDTFETALFMSVFSERRAKEYEVVLPQYRRGWIGNLIYADGFEDGCGVWIFEQRRRTQSTINGVRDEIEKGLIWLIDDDYANQINVDAEPSDQKILVSVVVKSNETEILNTKITV